jgi:hypothetical protein
LEKEKEKSYTYTCREEATMREEKSKTNKLAWSKKMVRKWFNIKSKTEEFQADDPSSAGIEVERVIEPTLQRDSHTCFNN